MRKKYIDRKKKAEEVAKIKASNEQSDHASEILSHHDIEIIPASRKEIMEKMNEESERLIQKARREKELQVSRQYRMSEKDLGVSSEKQKEEKEASTRRTKTQRYTEGSNKGEESWKMEASSNEEEESKQQKSSKKAPSRGKSEKKSQTSSILQASAQDKTNQKVSTDKSEEWITPEKVKQRTEVESRKDKKLQKSEISGQKVRAPSTHKSAQHTEASKPSIKTAKSHKSALAEKTNIQYYKKAAKAIEPAALTNYAYDIAMRDNYQGPYVANDCLMSAPKAIPLQEYPKNNQMEQKFDTQAQSIEQKDPQAKKKGLKQLQTTSMNRHDNVILEHVQNLLIRKPRTAAELAKPGPPLTKRDRRAEKLNKTKRTKPILKTSNTKRKTYDGKKMPSKVFNRSVRKWFIHDKAKE